MDLIIKNCRIITGDGVTDIPRGAVFIRGGRIEGVEPLKDCREISAGSKVIDASGLLLSPGVINGHCHGCTTGPLFPSGSRPLTLQKAISNARFMLRQGVTSLVNLCGLGDMDDIVEVARQVPVNIMTGTCHLPSALISARMVDGHGLSKTGGPDNDNVETMLSRGAVAIGEMGSGASLGGGVTEYKYIPGAVRESTGIVISPADAREIKEAVVGRKVVPGVADKGQLKEIMDRLGLSGRINIHQLIETVEKIALEPVSVSLDSFDEAFEVAQKTGVTAVFHNSIVSAPRLLDLCHRYENRSFTVVAGHSNHPSFTPQEAVEYARELRRAGAVIDISTLDCITTRWMNGPDNIEALAREGLIDTISTDYGGGHWDGILEGVHFLVNRGYSSLAQAVAMATGNVAGALPMAAPERGYIRKSMIADMVLTDPFNPGRVEMVFVGGKTVYDASRGISPRAC